MDTRRKVDAMLQQWRIAEVAQMKRIDGGSFVEDNSYRFGTAWECKLCGDISADPERIKHREGCPIAILRESEEEELGISGMY